MYMNPSARTIDIDTTYHIPITVHVWELDLDNANTNDDTSFNILLEYPLDLGMLDLSPSEYLNFLDTLNTTETVAVAYNK
jgi:hypothetical protein